MTTSGVYTFSISRDQIIRMAMLNIGKLEESEVPSAQEVSDCSTWLNLLVKQWQGKADYAPGLKTWTRKTGYLFLKGTSGTYTVGPAGLGWAAAYRSTTSTATAAASQAVIIVNSDTGMLVGDNFGVEDSTGSLFWSTIKTIVGTTITLNTNFTASVPALAQVFTYTSTASQPVVIENVMLRDNLINDTPVRIITTANEYYQMPSRQTPTNLSDPSSVYYEFNLGNSTLYTDVAGASDVTKLLVITYMEAVQDFVNPSDTPYYPQEWYLALALGLSKLIAPMFNAPWTPAMDESSKLALAIAQRKEPETSNAYFQCNDY